MKNQNLYTVEQYIKTSQSSYVRLEDADVYLDDVGIYRYCENDATVIFDLRAPIGTIVVMDEPILKKRDKSKVLRVKSKKEPK